MRLSMNESIPLLASVPTPQPASLRENSFIEPYGGKYMMFSALFSQQRIESSLDALQR